MYDEEKLNEALAKMTGLDYIAAQNRFKTTHPAFIGVLQLEVEFQLEIAAMALKVNANEIKTWGMREFVNVCSAVQRFLSSNSDENETA